MSTKIRTFVLRKKAIIMFYHLHGYFIANKKQKKKDIIDEILTYGISRIEQTLKEKRTVKIRYNKVNEIRQPTGGTTSDIVWERLDVVKNKLGFEKCEVIELCLYLYIKEKLGYREYDFFDLETWGIDFD